MNNSRVINPPLKWPFYIVLALVIAWFGANFFYGERIFVREGIGWDGRFYAEVAKHLQAFITNNNFTLSAIQRIFPSAVIYVFTHFLGYGLDTAQKTIRAFYLYNAVIFSLGAYFYYLIARLQRWSFSLSLIGFSAIFLNFATLKSMPYYPILTDYTAFILGLALLYFYLRNNVIGMVITIAIGAFTYSTVFFSGLFFLLFPYKKFTSEQSPFLIMTFNLPRYRFFFAVLFATLISSLVIMSYNYTVGIEENYALIYTHLRPMWVIVLSLICLFIYCIFMVIPFIKTQYTLPFRANRLLIVTALVILIKGIQHHFSNDTPGVPLLFYFRCASVESITNPLVFVVSHFIYYGPVVLLFIFYWQKIVAKAYEKSFAFVLTASMFGLISIGSESRDFINALPIFVFLLCEVLNEFKISERFAYGFLLLSLAVSKFWLPINTPGFAYNDAATPMEFLSLPYQRYLMNMGPWMHNKIYFVVLNITLVVAWFLWRWKKNLVVRNEVSA